MSDLRPIVALFYAIAIIGWSMDAFIYTAHEHSHYGLWYDLFCKVVVCIAVVRLIWKGRHDAF